MLKPTKHNQKRNKECMYVFRRRSSLLIGFRSAMSVSGDLWKTYINLQKCSKRLNGNSAVNVTSVLRFLHNQSKLTEFLASISVWFGCVYAKKYPFLNTRTETDIFSQKLGVSNCTIWNEYWDKRMIRLCHSTIRWYI